MKKEELIDAISNDAEITKKSASKALDSFFNNVTKALKEKDGKIVFTGFGTFSKVRRKARQGRNPQTGESMKIKAKNVVKFKAGKGLRESI